MMAKKRGIRRTSSGFEVYGRVGDKQFARRFPPDTPFSLMRRWREERISSLREEQPKALAGSLADAVAGLLKLETGRRATDFEDLLSHWCRAFGDKQRLMITPRMIQEQLDQWKVQGVAASTLNHRRQALRTLYRRMEPDSMNPVDRTKPYRQPEPEPRAIPDDVIDQIFAKMPTSASKARLLVICHTGMRHSELMRVRHEDVTYGDAGQVFVKSGKGGRHRVVPLHGKAQDAFALLDETGGWGRFSPQSLRKTWLAAALKAGHAKIDPESEGKTWQNILCAYRPYDLRHRFATRVRQLGADLADVQELLGHKNIQTTRRYAPVVHAKLVIVVNALDPKKEKDVA